MSETSTHILEYMESGFGWGMVPGTAQVPPDLDLIEGLCGCLPAGVVKSVP